VRDCQALSLAGEDNVNLRLKDLLGPVTRVKKKKKEEMRMSC